MYYYPYQYPIYPPLPAYPTHIMPQPYPRSYPPVDVKTFEDSVKSFRFLMDQARILLDRLKDIEFAKKMLSAAQQGKKADVDHLISTIGLKVLVVTKFTPTGVNFELISKTDPQHPVSCCTLNVAMKWGN
ncbi:hypothetical protein V7152_18550 [Neobacillus drentensis]|uniref:hypothetical protein n=1 Tax=Neobacillus drentensis TaxID=220684 RepID=UPI002FFDF194